MAEELTQEIPKKKIYKSSDVLPYQEPQEPVAGQGIPIQQPEVTAQTPKTYSSADVLPYTEPPPPPPEKTFMEKTATVLGDSISSVGKAVGLPSVENLGQDVKERAFRTKTYTTDLAPEIGDLGEKIGVPRDVSTAFMAGASLDYIPAEPPKGDVSITRKAVDTAAYLTGMAIALAGPSKFLGIAKAPTLVSGLMRTGVLGAGYGALKNLPPEESRMAAIAKDAVLFSSLGVASVGMKLIAGKIFPAVKNVLQKEIAGTALTGSEKAIKEAVEAMGTGTIGAGFGITEPADSIEERLSNAVAGGAGFMAGHYISKGAGVVAGRLKPKGLPEATPKVEEKPPLTNPELIKATEDSMRSKNIDAKFDVENAISNWRSYAEGRIADGLPIDDKVLAKFDFKLNKTIIDAEGKKVLVSDPEGVSKFMDLYYDHPETYKHKQAVRTFLKGFNDEWGDTFSESAGGNKPETPFKPTEIAKGNTVLKAEAQKALDDIKKENGPLQNVLLKKEFPTLGEKKQNIIQSINESKPTQVSMVKEQIQALADKVADGKLLTSKEKVFWDSIQKDEIFKEMFPTPKIEIKSALSGKPRPRNVGYGEDVLEAEKIPEPKKQRPLPIKAREVDVQGKVSVEAPTQLEQDAKLGMERDKERTAQRTEKERILKEKIEETKKQQEVAKMDRYKKKIAEEAGIDYNSKEELDVHLDFIESWVNEISKTFKGKGKEESVKSETLEGIKNLGGKDALKPIFKNLKKGKPLAGKGVKNQYSNLIAMLQGTNKEFKAWYGKGKPESERPKIDDFLADAGVMPEELKGAKPVVEKPIPIKIKEVKKPTEGEEGAAPIVAPVEPIKPKGGAGEGEKFELAQQEAKKEVKKATQPELIKTTGEELTQTMKQGLKGEEVGKIELEKKIDEGKIKKEAEKNQLKIVEERVNELVKDEVSEPRPEAIEPIKKPLSKKELKAQAKAEAKKAQDKVDAMKEAEKNGKLIKTDIELNQAKVGDVVEDVLGKWWVVVKHNTIGKETKLMSIEKKVKEFQDKLNDKAVVISKDVYKTITSAADVKLIAKKKGILKQEGGQIGREPIIKKKRVFVSAGVKEVEKSVFKEEAKYEDHYEVTMPDKKITFTTNDKNAIEGYVKSFRALDNMPLKDRISNGFHHVVEIGKSIYTAGMKLPDFVKNMKSALGKIYDTVKNKIVSAYTKVREYYKTIPYISNDGGFIDVKKFVFGGDKQATMKQTNDAIFKESLKDKVHQQVKQMMGTQKEAEDYIKILPDAEKEALLDSMTKSIGWGNRFKRAVVDRLSVPIRSPETKNMATTLIKIDRRTKEIQSQAFQKLDFLKKYRNKFTLKVELPKEMSEVLTNSTLTGELRGIDKLPKEQQEHVKAIFDTTKWMYDTYKEEYGNWLDTSHGQRYLKEGKTTKEAVLEGIEKSRRDMYIPMMRERGNYVVYAETQPEGKNKFGRKVWYENFEKAEDAKDRARWLMYNFPDYKLETFDVRNRFGGYDFPRLLEMIHDVPTMTSHLSKRGVNQVEIQKLVDVLEGKYMEIWGGGRLAKRENIAGFRQDWGNVLNDYIERFPRSYMRRFNNGNIADAISAADPEYKIKNQNLADYYLGRKDYEGNANYFMRNVIYGWNLGFKLSFPLLNLTQRGTTTYWNAMAEHKEGTKVFFNAQRKELGIIRELVSGKYSDKDTKMSGRRAIQETKLIDNVERETLLKMMDRGDIDTIRNIEIIGRSPTMRAMTILATMSEKSNRVQSALTGIEIGRKKGLSGEALYDYAANFTYETQWLYGKANRPEIGRGWKAPLFVFKSYVLNDIKFLQEMHGKNKQAFAGAVATRLALGGLGGVYGMTTINDAIDLVMEEIVGKEDWQLTKMETKKNLESKFGKDMVNIALKGLPYMAGVEGSITYGAGELFSIAGIPMVTAPWKDLKAAITEEGIDWGEMLRRRSPMALKHMAGFSPKTVFGKSSITREDVMKAPPEIRERVLEIYDDLVSDMSPFEATLYAIGFSTVTQNDYYEKVFAMKDAMRGVKTKKAGLHRKIGKAIALGDDEALNRIMDEADKLGYRVDMQAAKEQAKRYGEAEERTAENKPWYLNW